MRPIDRRRFFQDTAAVAAVIAANPRHAARAADDNDADAKPTSPNEILQVAVIGVRGRGMDHIEGFGHLKKDVRITTICDIDENATKHAKSAIEKLYGGKSP